jgi:3-hydroxyacyl-[acyl-carrier-protein] dehydratase
MSKQPAFDIHDIMRLLPHRYPFLLVDRILEHQPGEWLTAVKNVTMNEPFFAGHFPGRPVMPGVMILEAMAQASGMLAILASGDKRSEDELYFFVGIDNARFREQVEPGDQLIFKVRILATKRGIWKFSGVAEVDGRVAAEAELMCATRKIR